MTAARKSEKIANGRPIVLAVLDGWGIDAPGSGNAIALATTPVLDTTAAKYPCAHLPAYGGHVGLLPDQG